MIKIYDKSSKIFDHLLANNVLYPEQNGFFKGRSTCTNLLECLNDWTFSIQYKQDAQLSQRDRAAGWVSYGQK